ncbi:hypothetical protein Taro_020436 [Colocasia esculenta]|uniref:Uncharacterized protein n=1 Tax=Colocasia esculenta TaxID=4460 RepID=A0A843V576_COLES|nr:hypothetical protein [Colocasia esculenta]
MKQTIQAMGTYNDNRNNAKQPWGEPPPKSAKIHPGRTSPGRSSTKRDTSTAGATQRWPETNTKHFWEEPPPEATKGDPGKHLHQNAQPNDQTTQTIRENTAASRTIEATQAGSERTSTRTTKAPLWEKPSRTHQPNQQRTSDSEVARQQQKRVRNSPERNTHQDNNK